MNIPGRVATHEKQTPYRVFKGRNSPEFPHRYFPSQQAFNKT